MLTLTVEFVTNERFIKSNSRIYVCITNILLTIRFTMDILSMLT